MPSPAITRRLLPVLLGVLLVAGLSSPGPAEPVSVAHARGETILADTPRRVVVFDLATLDTLDLLGVPVLGVPGSHIPDYLGKYRGEGYAKVGSLFEPNYEAVNALKPDLVIVASRSAPAYDALSRIAPTIDLTPDPADFLGSAERNARLLGKIFGQEEKVASLIETLDLKVAETRAVAETRGAALVVMVSGGKLTAYGTGSRFGWLHRSLGFEPAAPDLKAATHGDAISFEFIAATNPDWLFVLDRDSIVGNAGQAASRVLDNELVASTKAARAGRIVYLDAVHWYLVGGGLDSVARMTEEIATALAGRK
ncbi:MAG: siderophore ABC transporter substrate-binding protein [Flavobacteriaceae bacterium]